MKQRAEILKKRLKYALSSDDPNEVKTVAEGGLWSASQQLTTPFNQLFVKQMGGGDFAIGLVNSLPALFARCREKGTVISDLRVDRGSLEEHFIKKEKKEETK